MHRKFISLALVASAPIASAITVYDITQMTANDAGNPGDIAFTKGGNTTITTKGDVNLVDFTVSDGNSTTLYKATDFISGIGISENSSITSNGVNGVIQHSDATSDGSLSYGNVISGGPNDGAYDVSDYLTRGERGLSFSSALNYTTKDPVGSFTFDLSFNSDPTAGDRPTFIIGDGADNQSADLWTFLDKDGQTLFTITLNPDDFSVFGDQVVDRVSSDNSGFNGGDSSSSNDTARGIGMAAFSLTTDDLGDADWNEVAQLSIRVPATGDAPKTDYAFFGVDTGLVESPDLVVDAVPEPSSTALLALGFSALTFRRKR